MGNVPTDKLFTGQRLDSTGLYYYNARYYDAMIGRFISPDAIIPNPANPQSFNRYSYCLNNPLKYMDPSGRIVVIGGLGDVQDLGMENLWWLTNMSDQAQEQVMNTLGAYEAFKASSPLAAHMAWTMEQDKEHTVTIIVGQEREWWADTTQSGSYYTINIHPETFLPSPWGMTDELWKPIYDEVTQEILDIKTNYDIWSAVWDELVSEAISLNVAVDATVTTRTVDI